MRRHLAYARYLLAHKWYVFVEGLKLGVPIWRLLLHDLDKFALWRWNAYARYFYNSDGSKRRCRDKTGYYRPAETGSEEFDRAVGLHCRRNLHHWQAWVLPADNGDLTEKVFEIPETYVREMVADWNGAGRAQGVNAPALEWYKANGHKLKLHPRSRAVAYFLLSRKR